MKRTRTQDRGGEAGLAFATRPTSRTAVAISQTRPRVVAATIPIAFWRLPAASSALARAGGEHLDPALDEPSAGADGVAEHWQPTKQKYRERGGQQH